MRQRAIATGILPPDLDDQDTVGAAIERLLADEVSVPAPTDAECERYYKNHLKEFESGDLVYARHILFQVTPSVSVPEIRARAEHALSELLAEPDRFTDMARDLSNCPSGQQGGNLGRVDLVMFRLAAMDRLHGEGMPADTREVFVGTAVGEPIPGEQTCDRHDETLSIRGNDVQEGPRVGFHVTMHQNRAAL